MPLALSFMLALLFSGGRAGADLVVGAVAAGLVAGRGLEAARPNARRRRLDGLPGLREVALGWGVAPGDAGFEETQLDARGQPARHLLLGQRVHLQLEALARAAVRRLLLGDIARLVVDDDGAEQRVVDAIEAAAHPRGAEREA